MRHADDKCIEFSRFLSCEGVYKITLRNDSCLCNACHRDCLRSCGKPQWLRLAKHAICKHCFVCCPGPMSCACDSINEWGPVQQFEENEVKDWAEVLQWDVNINIEQEQNVCKRHYVAIHKAMSNRACKVCNNSSNTHWFLGKELLKEMGQTTLSDHVGISELDWVCENCFNTIIYPNPI